jgi:hypothetical protein
MRPRIFTLFQIRIRSNENLKQLCEPSAISALTRKAIIETQLDCLGRLELVRCFRLHPHKPAWSTNPPSLPCRDQRAVALDFKLLMEARRTAGIVT